MTTHMPDRGRFVRLFSCLLDRLDWQWIVSWVVIGIALLSVAGLWPMPVRAAEIPATELRDLYAIAYGRAGIGVPEKPPRVYFASPALLRALLRCQDCDPRGVQIADAVFYRDDLGTDPLSRSVLVHEFVHYVQWVRYGAATTCEEWAAREAQAYRVQREVLERVDISVAVPEIERCP